MPQRRRLIVCLTVTAVMILALGLLFITLGLTVFKPKDPIINVDSISLADLNFSVDLPALRVYLNVSLDTDLTVTNPNRVGFKHGNSTAYLSYRGNDIGEVPVPAGKIGARSTGDMNVTLTVMADRLISDHDFFSDVISGTIAFQTRVRLKGKVRLLFNVHVVAYATCDIQIHLPSRSLFNQTCHYKTKL